MSARLSPEDGALVLAALEAGRSALETPPQGAGAKPAAAKDDSAESPSPETKSADALVAVARLALSAPDGATPPSAEIVVVDRAVLAGDADEGRCYLDGGVAIPPDAARRLACDAMVVTLLEAANGTPLDVGRKRRIPPGGCGGHWVAATEAAGSRGAGTAASSTPTTSCTGRPAARPASPI